MSGRRVATRIALAVLAGLHLLALGADLVAPYGPVAQDRERPYAPPTRVRFVDAEGEFHRRPFV